MCSSTCSVPATQMHPLPWLWADKGPLIRGVACQLRMVHFCKLPCSQPSCLICILLSVVWIVPQPVLSFAGIFTMPLWKLLPKLFLLPFAFILFNYVTLCSFWVFWEKVLRHLLSRATLHRNTEGDALQVIQACDSLWHEDLHRPSQLGLPKVPLPLLLCYWGSARLAHLLPIHCCQLLYWFKICHPKPSSHAYSGLVNLS